MGADQRVSGAAGEAVNSSHLNVDSVSDRAVKNEKLPPGCPPPGRLHQQQ